MSKPASESSAEPPETALGWLDAWMADSPWHPRVVPFFCWILFLAVTTFLPESLAAAQPAVYLLQCLATVWLLWRYRRLTPELTVSFHWLVIPSALLLTLAWIVLGFAMGGELGWRVDRLMEGQLDRALGAYPYAELGEEPNRFGPQLNAELVGEPHPILQLIGEHPALGYASLMLRLVGMALIVPFFEELFIRSAMLRGLQRPGPTKRGLLQLASDLPLIGELIHDRPSVRAAAAKPPAFTAQLKATPVGRITVFAVAASTLVFMLSHAPRDWPGCIACGVVWCLMVWWTNRPRESRGETWESLPARGRLGLGPVIWSHALVNALLWGYTLQFDEWRFL